MKSLYTTNSLTMIQLIQNIHDLDVLQKLYFQIGNVNVEM